MFYIGQDIVCIKDHKQGVVKEGQIYTITALKTGCCGQLLISVGKSAISQLERCWVCKNVSKRNDNVFWLAESLFKPLDELSDISELLEVLNKENYQKV